MRPDGRDPDELRPTEIESEFIVYPEGSILISTGRTKVLCNASIEEGQPSHLYNTDQGWVTAEYNMLPRSAPHRQVREVVRGRRKGRTHEIQRIIGRSLRAVIDLDLLGPRTIWVDCDVLQADGGTRTASITGGFLATAMAIDHMVSDDRVSRNPIKAQLAAVSVGKVDGEILLDLNYEEDNKADVDVNFAMTSDGRFVEIQASGEESIFDYSDFETMAERARKGVQNLSKEQEPVLNSLDVTV